MRFKLESIGHLDFNLFFIYILSLLKFYKSDISQKCLGNILSGM